MRKTRRGLALAPLASVALFAVGARVSATAPPVPSCEATSTITSVPSSDTSTGTVMSVPVTLPDDWFPFESAAGDFTVSFPGEPDSETQDVTLPDGSVAPTEVHSHYEGEYGFLVSRVTYAPGTVVSLEGARDGSIANVGGTLESSTSIELQCHAGIEFAATVTSGGETGNLLSRVYAVDNVLYQLIVVGPAHFGTANANAFFDSFTFTGEAAQ